MDTLIAGGVNRISVGAQSFHPALLKTLERWHEPASVARAVGILRAAGIANFNLDLIFAIPGQTMDQLAADLDAALALQPTHLSCYGLTYEPNTAMTKRLQMGQFKPADEELERDMYAMVLERLSTAGFDQYEVSNWARHSDFNGHSKDFRCQHNLMYWTNEDWLGVGPAAASHIAGFRWKNLPHIGKYLDSTPEPPITDLEHLPDAQRIGEELMLRLRLIEGAPDAWLAQRLPPNDPRWETIRYLVSLGMLEQEDAHLRLTRKGLFVADAVIKELL
jgi:oxygen-independent coproporphyrinogen-3 oxidase